MSAEGNHHNSILSPLPSDPVFKEQVRQSSNVIKALVYENHQQHQAALETWRLLSHPETEKVQDRIFYFELIDLSSEKYPQVPATEASRYLMARYLSWVKKWRRAFNTIAENGDLKLDTLKMNLEFIRLGLYLGEYTQVKALIDSVEITNRREQLQVDILKTWYYLLEEKTQNASRISRKISDEYLYVSLATIRPFGWNFAEYNRLEPLLTELIRFPMGTETYEEIVIRLLSNQKWNQLSQLKGTHLHITGRDWDWHILAELYLEVNQPEKLRSLLQAVHPNKHNSPEYFEINARMAIKNNQWDLLHDIAHRYQNQYPDILDGKMYLAEFYRQTGNIGELRSIMSDLPSLTGDESRHQ